MIRSGGNDDDATLWYDAGKVTQCDDAILGIWYNDTEMIRWYKEDDTRWNDTLGIQWYRGYDTWWYDAMEENYTKWYDDTELVQWYAGCDTRKIMEQGYKDMIQGRWYRGYDTMIRTMWYNIRLLRWHDTKWYVGNGTRWHNKVVIRTRIGDTWQDDTVIRYFSQRGKEKNIRVIFSKS